MPESINSNANKILLAQILQNHPLATVNNIQFQQLITQETNRIHRQRFQFHSDLTIMNKEVIKRITGIGKQMIAQVPIKKPQLPPTAPVSKNFESRLKEQQDNFLKLVNPSKPKDIDFSDKVTEGVIPTMDTTLLQREKELRAIMKDYKTDSTAKQWIENEDVNNISSNISNNTITINPEPTQPIRPDPLPVTPQKRVTFEIAEKDSSDSVSFLNKLKKKKDNTLLSIIEEKEPLSPKVAPKVAPLDISSLLEESISLQKKTLQTIEQLTIFLQNQFSQSSHLVADTLSK
jgi:hypothetical protein